MTAHDERALWRHYYMQHPRRQDRCEVRTFGSEPQQCPNVARFVLFWLNGERDGKVCDSCLPGWINSLTASHGAVTVERLQ